MSSILSHVPSQFNILRPQQIDILTQVERDWNRYDIFIINAPVALGKSLISLTIASWAGDTSILVPNNILRNQYADEFPELHVVRSKAEYICNETDITVAEYDKRADLKSIYCPCEGHAAYRQMRDDIMESGRNILANYYAFTAFTRFGTHKRHLIIDEAHNLNAYLQQFGRRRIWQHDQHYPNPMNTRLELMQWVEGISPGRYECSKSEAFRTLLSDIRGNKPKYIYEFTRAFHGKKSRDRDDLLPVINMYPVDLRGLDLGSRYMWPVSDKVVLLSATISKFDIEAFGMAGKRIKYIEVDSPIPAERRPVILPAERRNMAFAHQQLNIPHFIKFILQLADKHWGENGLIHAPYNLARQLRPYLDSDERFIFHGKEDKKAKYAEFLQGTGRILVASGMYEGISLNYDLCRWQVIAKVPFVSLAEPAVRYLASCDRDWYGWATLRDLLQASGRVCRSETDRGTTYIYDLLAERLLTQMKGLTPKWFTEAVHIETQLEIL